MLVWPLAVLVVAVGTWAMPVQDADFRPPPMPLLADLMESAGDQPLESLADLDTFVDTVRKLAHLQISKAFSVETRRVKRALDIESVNVTGTHPYDLGLMTYLKRVTSFKVLRSKGKTYCIVGGYRNETQVIVEMSWPEHKILQVVEFELSSTSFDKVDKITVYMHMSFVWVAMGSSSAHLVTIVCMNPANGQVAVPQNIPVQLLGGLHMFQASGELFLVVGENDRGALSEVGVDSALYMLMGKYFDRVDGLRLRTKGVQAVTGFADGGNHYLVFGMKSDEGSQVYKFDSLMYSMELIQQLPDTDVLQVLHYVDRHDRKHYLITVNNGATPKIYWWTREQLQEWQILESSPIDYGSSIAIHFLDNLENIIFLSHGSEITFYTDNMSAHYFPSYTLKTSCISIGNLYGLRMLKDYIITYTCQQPYTGEVTIEGKMLLFHEVKLAESEERADSLLKCLDELGTALNNSKGDIDYISGVLSSSALMTVDDEQVWKGPVIFSKGLTVTGTTIFEDSLRIDASANTTNMESFTEFISLFTSLQLSVNSLVKQSEGVVYFTGNQALRGPITVSTLRVNRTNFDVLKIRNVNGVAMLDLKKEFLITGIDQVINTNVTASSITTDVFTTRSVSPSSTINGILTTEFMRKSVSEQVVTGDHTYSTVTCDGITNTIGGTKSLLINGINSSTIVTKGSSVTFLDVKNFKKLTIQGPVNTGLVNGVDVRDLNSRVIYTDTTKQQLLADSYTMARVKVIGNVDVPSINGINLRDLDASVVKRTGDFTLKGAVTYEKSLTITGNLWTTSINGVEWDDLVDFNSKDTISGNYFIDNVYVSDAIECNNINGLDLSQDVVLVDTTQTIHGPITFTKDVLVTGAGGVLMGDGATINNIDPSELQTSTVSQGVLVVKDAATFSVPLKGSGDVVASTINGLVLDGITDRYWRRSVDQDINVQVHINNAVFLNTVKGSSINGNQMTDYLNLGGSQQISGSYNFQNMVTVLGNLVLGPGSTVNGIDVVALNNTVMTLLGDQTIEGPMDCASQMTIAELNLYGRLNGIDMMRDLMRLDQSLVHTGHLTFTSKTTATNVIINGDLTVDSLNGFDVGLAAADMVMVDEDATIRGPFGLRFIGDLSVTTLEVRGTVDGVDFEDLMQRALLKSSPRNQLVRGHITVMGAVHFRQAPSLVDVNSKKWEIHLDDVVLKDFSGKISGTKTFLKPLNILGNFDPATINGIKVADLTTRYLTKSSEQIIHSHYTFTSSITFTHLSSPVIDGVNMSQVLMTDQTGYLGGTAIFLQNLTFLGDVMSKEDTLGECDLKKLDKLAIQKDKYGNIEIYSPVQMKYLTIIGTVNSAAAVLAGTAQKVDLEYFLNTLVLKSQTQDINGAVEFLGDVNITSLYVNTINGVNMVDLYKYGVMDNEDTVITCNLEFSKPLTVNNMVVTSSVSGRSDGGVLVNDVNITHLETQAVRTGGQTYVITGKKTFSKGFSTYNLIVNKTLGGVAVQDLVTFSGVGSLAQDVIFHAPIIVRGNLQVLGLVDGVNLSQVFASRVTLHGMQTVYGNCEFDSIVVEGDLEVEKINDVLISDLVMRNGNSQIINGQKTIDGGLIIIGNINTTLLNGINIPHLDSIIVRKDRNTTITHPVVFKNSVRTLSGVEVDGTVGSIDVLNLRQNVMMLGKDTESRYREIMILKQQLINITSANYAGMKGMFSVLAYLEKKSFRNLDYYGGVTFIRNYNLEPDNNFLSVKNCDRDCLCGAKTRLYRVSTTGTIASVASLVSPGSLFILSHPSANLQVTLNLTCAGGVSTSFTFEALRNGYLYPLLRTRMSLGLITDAGLFVDRGATYIVTVAMFANATDSVVKPIISTLKFDASTSSLTSVWEERTQRSAAKLDLTIINNIWFLLVANQLGIDSVDMYTTVSKLYTWNSTQQRFIPKGEYVADHVTSGMFLKTYQPVEENLFTLTQLKAAKYPLFEENLEYTKKVLVFRNNEMDSFVEFESLDTVGVVDQATFTVGDSLYLLLLSEVKEKLDVYEYFPLEGFKLCQKVPIEKPYAVEVMKLPSATFVIISSRSPPGFWKLKVKTKGVDSSLLLQ
ncbi:uncharacterized protein LOC121860162 [Homarus americanus]|uniref:uncharacterized protein LOC121860162 n=1 Tax=Homarus americanus TaxID=6706 RepID=UPI001C439040|nr:uncharacterized protein LOC121860162 [Homarus americanus]